jgi:molybdopterin adenylyltransferase
MAAALLCAWTSTAQYQEAALPLDENRIFKPVNIALLTVSDTRTAADDTSGDILATRITAAGHNLCDRAVVTDDATKLVARLHGLIDDEHVDCVILTGGTGLTGRDITPEALDRVKSKDIPGFGELFRILSFESIGTSTIQSRACAVLARGTYIFALPGSNGAVKDGWDQILVHQLDSRHSPCNFVELMPRLREA